MDTVRLTASHVIPPPLLMLYWICQCVELSLFGRVRSGCRWTEFLTSTELIGEVIKSKPISYKPIDLVLDLEVVEFVILWRSELPGRRHLGIHEVATDVCQTVTLSASLHDLTGNFNIERFCHSCT